MMLGLLLETEILNWLTGVSLSEMMKSIPFKLMASDGSNIALLKPNGL